MSCDNLAIPTQMLQECISTLSARGKGRDSGKERSMTKTVELFNTLTNSDLTESEGWQFMVLLKLVRGTTRFDVDNFMDAASYLALAQESEVLSEATDGS